MIHKRKNGSESSSSSSIRNRRVHRRSGASTSSNHRVRFTPATESTTGSVIPLEASTPEPREDFTEYVSRTILLHILDIPDNEEIYFRVQRSATNSIYLSVYKNCQHTGDLAIFDGGSTIETTTFIGEIPCTNGKPFSKALTKSVSEKVKAVAIYVNFCADVLAWLTF